MISQKLLGLPDLFRAQVFDIHELLEVVVIGENKYFEFGVFSIIVPSLKNLNNGK